MVDVNPDHYMTQHQPAIALRAIQPLASPRAHNILLVRSERELLLMARELKTRVAQDPEFSVLFFANPVLALKAYGIKLTPQLRRHLLRSLRHPKPIRERRAYLEASLKEALGEFPRPTNRAWLARLVFQTRQLAPRDIKGLAPAYGPEIFDQAIQMVRRERPASTDRYPEARLLKGSMSLSVAPVRASSRRLDLKAPVPDTKPARVAPKTLTLEEAWFYKEDPVVAEAVELGQIARRALAFRTPATFRKLQAGEKVDVFRSLVRGVSIKDSKTP